MGLKLEVGKYYKTRDGRKVGPMKNSYHTAGYYCWHTLSGNYNSNLWNEDGCSGSACDADLIALWQDKPTGPVRTVTRKEIVSGQYGIVNVDADRPTGNPRIVVSAVPTAAELRAAIATLTEIAQVLEDQ